MKSPERVINGPLPLKHTEGPGRGVGVGVGVAVGDGVTLGVAEGVGETVGVGLGGQGQGQGSCAAGLLKANPNKQERIKPKVKIVAFIKLRAFE